MIHILKPAPDAQKVDCQVGRKAMYVIKSAHTYL